jgi:hypothetical protein
MDLPDNTLSIKATGCNYFSTGNLSFQWEDLLTYYVEPKI